MNRYITAGELAKLATTTKRTIQFYDKKGVLKPAKINESKYRLYFERQVLDYQMILLLSTLGVSLTEIKSHLKKRNDLAKLFEKKEDLIKNKIEEFNFNLKNIRQYLLNLKNNKTLVNPKIKFIKPFRVYYLDKIGSYAKIGSYCQELEGMFLKKGRKFTTLTIFENQNYSPKKSKMKICALYLPGMELKKNYINIVQEMVYNPGKVMSYMYHGRGEMLSLFWKELEKYCKLKKYQVRTDVFDYEIYWKVSVNLIKQEFEFFLPIK